MSKKIVGVTVASMLVSAMAMAQQPQNGQLDVEAVDSMLAQTTATSEYVAVDPNPADVASIDAIITAAYESINGPAGQARDWDRMRSLFYPGARLIPTAMDPNTGATNATVMSVEQFINTTGGFLVQNGFFEREIGRHTDEYGNIVQAFSAYAARQTETGPVFMRGINSFQLLNTGEGGYRILSIFWHTETPETPVPEMYID